MIGDYLVDVREVERRIQAVETFNRGGELRELLEAPAGVPDSAEHVRLGFDVQLLAFESDITRAFSFKLGRDNSNRAFPESGFGGAFYKTSPHGGREDRIRDFATINRYHVATIVPFFIAGRAGGALRGLGILQALGLEDVERFGDSTAAFDLTGGGAGGVRNL